MTKFQWVRVSAASPCPICKKPDWCRISRDATVAGCMRVEPGCFKAREGKDGSTIYLHRLSGDRAQVELPPASSSSSAKRADPNTLHGVYSAILDRLTLSKAHKETLHHRGLNNEAITRAGYRSLPVRGRARIIRELQDRFSEQLLRVPGIVVKEGKLGRYLTLSGPAGLIVPCRDQGGRILALKVRRDDAADEGRRYSYCSSTGHGGPSPGSPIHFPVGIPEKTDLVRVTEGELKGDVCFALSAVPTAAIPGVSSWRAILQPLHDLGCKTVRLALDMDAWDNAVVARSLSIFATELVQKRFSVELERWTLKDGKGLDDLLAAGKAPELLQGEAALQTVQDILATATSGEEPTAADELHRLQDVLDTNIDIFASLGIIGSGRVTCKGETMARKKQENPTVTEQLRQFIRDTGKTTYRLWKDRGCKPEQIGRFLSGERDLSGRSIDRLCKAMGLMLAKTTTGNEIPMKEN